MTLVTRLADVKAAVAAGGEVTLDEPWPISLTDVAPAIPAVLKGQVSRLLLNRCRNIVVDGVQFRRTATLPDGPDISVNACSDIVLSRLDMLGPSKTFNDGTALVGQGAIEIGHSQRVTVEEARIDGYGFGIRGGNNDGLTIRRSEFTRLQRDGIQLGNRVSGVVIEECYLHDFLGSLHKLNHDDMIQVYTTGATVASHGLTIRKNRLIGGAGASTQMIFVKNDAAKDRPDLLMRGVVIEGNYVSGDDWQGITVYWADKPVIRNNIVLRKRGMPRNESGNDGIYIQTPHCVGAVVDGNVADRLSVAGSTGANRLAAATTPDQMREALDRMLSYA